MSTTAALAAALIFLWLGMVLAVVIAVALIIAGPGTAVLTVFAVAAVALAAQLVAVRPALTKRSDAVLAAGPDAENLPRSQAHFGYVGLELVKVIALLTAGTVLLAG